MDWGYCKETVIDPNTKKTIGEIPTLHCIIPLFQNIVNWALTLSGAVALIMIIWAGIKLLSSRGDQKQVQGARQTLTYAIIGLVLILLSFFIINFIGYITGASCITQFGFTNCG